MNYFGKKLTEKQATIIQMLRPTPIAQRELEREKLLKGDYLLKNAIILLENELLNKKEKKNELIVFDMETLQTEEKGTESAEIIKKFKQKKENMEYAYGYIIYNYIEFVRDTLDTLKDEEDLVQIKILLEILKAKK